MYKPDYVTHTHITINMLDVVTFDQYIYFVAQAVRMSERRRLGMPSVRKADITGLIDIVTSTCCQRVKKIKLI